MSKLFREEVLRAHTAQHLGTIRIGRDPGFGFVTAVALTLAACLVAFALWGQVTRKARLPGLLMPALGTFNLSAPQAGTLLEIAVHEGQVVQAGQTLLRLGTDRATAQGEAAVLIAHSLQQRRHALLAERSLAEQAAAQRHQALADRLRSNAAEATQAEGELDAVQRRLQLAAKTTERYRALAQDGFVADIQAQQKHEDWLDLGTRERSARRTLEALARDARALRAEQLASAGAAQTQLVQIDRALASLAQEATENSARGQLLLTAPQAGMVTALQHQAGETVQAGQTLATIVPQAGPGQDATLQAHLYAASRTAGFVQPGQTVWLRYAAYPYQKFGMAQGRIEHVSRTPINPQDLPTGQAQALMSAAQTTEPLYRVTVALARQEITTYGAPQPLKPGMALEADVLQERRAVWEWMLEPVLAASGMAKVLRAKPDKAADGG
jgi:membrane fusion protein